MTPKFKYWLKCALIRSVRTIAQTMVATIGTSVAIGDVDWKLVLSSSVLAGILSILTSVATGLPEVDKDEELKATQRENKELREQEAAECESPKEE